MPRSNGHPTSAPVQQDWVCSLSFMQQSVLMAAMRGPDGIRKNHPVKSIMRWYRRCTLFSAFGGHVFKDPFASGGGSFTGPFTFNQAKELFERVDTMSWEGERWRLFRLTRELYLGYVDELPHHFQLHLMHAAQIIGYKHPVVWIREWWKDFYLMLVNDMHLFPESEEDMDKRLGDDEAAWKAREKPGESI